MTTLSEANDAQGDLNKIDFQLVRFGQALNRALVLANVYGEKLEELAKTKKAIMEMVTEHFVVKRAELTETAHAIEDKSYADHEKSFGPEL